MVLTWFFSLSYHDCHEPPSGGWKFSDALSDTEAQTAPLRHSIGFAYSVQKDIGFMRWLLLLFVVLFFFFFFFCCCCCCSLFGTKSERFPFQAQVGSVDSWKNWQVTLRNKNTFFCRTMVQKFLNIQNIHVQQILFEKLKDNKRLYHSPL